MVGTSGSNCIAQDYIIKKGIQKVTLFGEHLMTLDIRTQGRTVVEHTRL